MSNEAAADPIRGDYHDQAITFGITYRFGY
jgi:hypothetical protein